MKFRSWSCAAVYFILTGCLLTGEVSADVSAESQAAINQILEVNREGAGHAEAISALQQLQQQGPELLMPLLNSLETANPLAANWLRNAFEAISAKSAGQLPLDEFKTFLADLSKKPSSRRLVFEWLQRAEPETAARMIPGFINDPSDELRREAVALLLQETANSEGEKQKELLQLALTGASDDDQVREIVKGLKEFEIEVDLKKHYGLLTEWYLIGPFDNKEEKGFPVVYPPEKAIDLSAEYEGQLGTVTWNPYKTDDNYGKLNIASELGPYKGAIVYGYTTFASDTEQPIEFRLATPNAWKLWLNGELLFAREEYHRGTFFDQYRIPAKLKAGKNEILIKSCQNEQEQSWAQDWDIQFRVCNPYGMAVLPAN